MRTSNVVMLGMLVSVSAAGQCAWAQSATYSTDPSSQSSSQYYGAPGGSFAPSAVPGGHAYSSSQRSVYGTSSGLVGGNSNSNPEGNELNQPRLFNPTSGYTGPNEYVPPPHYASHTPPPKEKLQVTAAARSGLTDSSEDPLILLNSDFPLGIKSTDAETFAIPVVKQRAGIPNPLGYTRW